MLVEDTLREWTADLAPEDARISVFKHIRDIPYSLVVPMTDPDTAPEQILSLGKGYCGPKHFLLSEMYRKLGYEVAYATFPFLWNDPDLHYPRELRQLSTGLPVAYHLACRVRIESRWILVDATWDLPLARGGFPVNDTWDGWSDTLCAVKPLLSPVRTAFCRTAAQSPYRNPREKELNQRDGEQDHGDGNLHVRYYRDKTGIRTAEEIGQIRRFFGKFDIWLQDIRKMA